MKTTGTFLLPFLLLALLFTACKKEVIDDDDDTPVAPAAVKAGVYDSSYVYQEYTPPLSVTLSWDSVFLYGWGSMTVDLDGNGDDLVLNLTVLNYDSIHLLNGQLPDPFPSIRFNSLNTWEIANEKVTFGIGLGQTASAVFIRPFVQDEQINTTEMLWGSGLQTLWAQNPGTFGPPYGPWYTVPQGYLGLKIPTQSGAYRYGWLELDNSDHNDPKILRAAFQQ